jgi:hypothetical protein
MNIGYFTLSDGSFSTLDGPTEYVELPIYPFQVSAEWFVGRAAIYLPGPVAAGVSA